jgi:hypothetical protein
MREAYRASVLTWAEDRLSRMSRAEKHPVYDFLFEYYSFRPAHLLRWTPGFGIVLDSACLEDVGWSEFSEVPGGLVLSVSAFPKHRIDYLKWAVDYLRQTSEREPSFTCLGLHEWAMVYRDPAVRHPYVPFRLSREETDAFVASQPLTCTHYDAFRFFSNAARPLNRWELTRVSTAEHDQGGCVHVNMDLYRFAYKIAPFCSSELMAESFHLARTAREVDMRASPYDLRDYGFDPIRIETPAGRAEYVALQKKLHQQGRPVRHRLLETYQALLRAVTPGQL